MRVIVTRPRAQAETLVQRLAADGIDAVVLPLIDIEPLADTGPLERLWRDLPRYKLAVFVSANAVQQFMRHKPAGAAWPAGLLAASTGKGTSAALRDAGVPRTQLLEPAGDVSDSEALWIELQRHDWRGRGVVVLRGEDGRDWLAQQLGDAGASVEFVAAYARRPPRLDTEAQSLLERAAAAPAAHLWLFGSSEAVANLGRLAPGADWSAAQALAPHERIVAAARQLGYGHVTHGAIDAPGVARAIAASEGRPIQSGPS